MKPCQPRPRTRQNDSGRTKCVRLLAQALASSPTILAVYSPLLIVQTLVGIAIPFATGAFIDAVVRRSSPLVPFLVLAALSFSRMMLSPLLQRFLLARSRVVELRLQNRVLEHIVDLPPAKVAAYPYGELVAKLVRDAAAIGGFVRGLYPRLLVALVMMFAAGASLYARAPIVGIVFMAFIPLSILVFAPFARKFARNSHAVRLGSDVTYNSLFEFFNVLPFLKSLAAEARFVEVPKASLATLKANSDATDTLSTVFGFLLGALLVVGEVAVVGFAGWLAARGRIPVGDVVVYQMLFVMALEAVQGIITLLPDLSFLREGADSICELLAREQPPTGHVPVTRINRLDCRHVTFGYPGAACPVVRDFSAAFEAGMVVGLAGANGTGKTTLLKLLIGALEPTSGEVRANGIPLAELDPGAFRRRVGAVFQESLLFTGTIRENVTLRSPDYSSAEIDRALVLSGLAPVVARLPQGLETPIGYKGRRLSGGECQRLALARALIRDPDVLVLDELTNHLDAEACAALPTLLARLRPGRIILVVSHDPAVLALCDRRLEIGSGTPIDPKLR